MKKIKMFLFFMMVNLSAVFAVPITFMASDGPVTIEIPADIAGLVTDNIAKINEKLSENNVDSSKLKFAESQIDKAYSEMRQHIPTVTPFNDVTEGLNDFCGILADVIPNTQTMQNVYPMAWIGNLSKGLHCGGGLNLGVSGMDIKPIKNVMETFDIDVPGSIPDMLAFPTATVDIRIGGIILPFDVGFAVSWFDVSRFSSLEKDLDPVKFDYLSIGGNIRYAIYRGNGLIKRWSVGGGYYFTKGGVEISDDKAEASLDFKSQTIMLETQVSGSILIFQPYLGMRALFTKTNVDWKAKANWTDILDDPALVDVMSWGVLPTEFDGGSDTDFFDKVHPQIFCGIGAKVWAFTSSLNLAYDFVSRIPSVGLNWRMQF